MTASPATVRPARHFMSLLAAIVLALVLAPWSADARAAQEPPLIPRVVPPKPLQSKVLPGYSRTRVVVKFSEGSGVRLQGAHLMSDSDVDVSEVNALLRRHPGLTIRSLFTRTPAALGRDRAAAQRASRREHADLSLYFRLMLPPTSNVETVIDELNALSIVELASAEPLPQAPPVTPDFEPLQGYRGSAPKALGARLVAGIHGALGDRVQVVDIEFGWRRNHEDLSKAAVPGALIPIGTPANPYDPYHSHGTAVAAVLVGDDNGYGVTGIVPNATLRMVNAYSNEWGYVLAEAIDLARANMSAGDVMLIEQQIVGPLGDCQPGCVPIEWYRLYYDVIVQATAVGIIVVEAAGNGSQNLNNKSLYGDPFPNGLPNSGAILVGAGAAPSCGSPARSRLAFSNYGTRVDVQGWGQCVTTAGYGDLQGGTVKNQWYTSKFSGTSSASAMVAGAAAAISSVHEAAFGIYLTSGQVRRILIDTGTPQNTTSSALNGNIGPLPNLEAALSGPYPADTTPPLVSAPKADFRANVAVGTSSAPVKLRVSFGATDAGGIDRTRLQQKVDSAPYSNVALASPNALAANLDVPTSKTTVRRFRARATDTSANTSAYAAAPPFRVMVRQDGAAAILQSGTWSTHSLSSNYGGSVRRATAAGAGQSLTSTMQDVAIVSTRGPDRGKAQVLVDGVHTATVDLYRATTQYRRVVWSMSFDAAATHSVEFVVTGNKNSLSTGRGVDLDAFLLMRP
jgi:serine protease